MIVKGSMNYDQFGRKRKKKATKRRKIPNKVAISSNKTTKSSNKVIYPSAKPTEYKTPEDTSYKKEISKQYTVSIAYNKGAYQVIPRNEVKDIGK
tara:strand:- start:1 stop:285 length:285 start_codon:yes stop_codon:yes gene_type:complete